jgi:hypothetical protein
VGVPRLQRSNEETVEKDGTWVVIASWRKALFGWSGFVFWAGILFATLYPFQFHPSNDVRWIEEGNGLRFGRHGILLSKGDMLPGAPENDSSFSIEVLLKPSSLAGVSTFLVLSSARQRGQIRIQQYLDGLIIWRDFRPAGGRPRSVKRDVDHFFIPGQVMLLTLSSGPKGTSVYSNGQLLERFPAYKLSREDLSGRLVFGTDAAHIDPWSGELLGLAVYDRELQPSQAAEHYQAWNAGRPAREDREDGQRALFLCDERRGQVVHNLYPHGADLTIPTFFALPQKPFLSAPWKEFSWSRDYLGDVLRNIIGFVPLGFAACGFFSFGGTKHRAILLTILLGATTSLGIEVLQAFIPYRESGLTDVITNTLGTAVGALSFGWDRVGNIFGRSRMDS